MLITYALALHQYLNSKQMELMTLLILIFLTQQPEDGINENETKENNEGRREPTQPSRDQGEHEETEVRYPARSRKPADIFM